MERYQLDPVALQTSDNTSECIDCMLTKPTYKLCDFLYSVFNTNEYNGKIGNQEKTQLFDTKHLRESIVDLKEMDGRAKKSNETTLKLQMAFCDRKENQAILSEVINSVRKQSIQDY